MTGKTELEKKLLGSKLWSIWLWVCIVLSALADVNVLISLAIQNISFSYTIFPLVLLILDLALAGCAAISNFRFRHSLIAPIVYGVFTVVITLVFWIWFSATADYVIFTNTAFVMWIVMQLLTVAVTILSAIRASGSGMIMRLVVFICAIIYAVYGITYIVMVSSTGFFGQAGDGYNGYSYSLRTIGYTYDDSTDTYTASAVLSGDGNTVVVPEEFNGKKVTKVSSDLLMARGVTTLVLESSEKVELLDIESGFGLSYDSFRMYTQPSLTDYYRNQFYELAKTHDRSDYDCTYTACGNCVKPITEKGEHYISFTYSYSSLVAANYNTLSTLVVNDGTEFQNTLITDSYDYMTYSDEESEADRYNSYRTNEDHMMLSSFTDEDGNALKGVKITADENVPVEFTEVYQVSVLEDNDDLYELPASLRYYQSSESTPYRYVTAGTCDTLLDELEGREGFSYVWAYYKTATGSATDSITNFASVLYDNMRIYPTWELNAPAAPVINGSTSITYGSTLSLSTNFKPAYDWEDVSYSWSVMYSGTGTYTDLGTDSSYSNSTIVPSESGTYRLFITIFSESVTSLTSVNYSTVSVSVAKKSLPFTWTNPSDMTYSASEKTITCDYSSSAVVNGDSITYSTSNMSATNAGTYTASVTLTGDCAELYTATNSTHSYTISKYNLAVTWGTTSFVYDGTSHIPDYTITTLGSDDAGASITGAITNAGTGTAKVTISNSNYSISNNSTSFTVTPASVTINWITTDFTYDGSSHFPTYEIEGLVGTDSLGILFSDSGKTNAGSYNVTVSKTNSNYSISEGSSVTYTIAQAEVSLNWSSTDLIYCGATQAPYVTSATGLVGSQTISVLNITYTDGQKDVGSYSVTASISATNYKLADSDSNATCTYSISAYELNVSWSNTSLTYNGSAQAPTYSYGTTKLGSDTISDTLLGATLTGAQTNAGDSYTASLSITNSNYTLTNNSTSYSIAKKTVTISWSNTSFTYDGQSHIATATASGLVETDGVTLNVTGEQKDAGTYQATASLSSDTNYTLSGSTTQQFTISAKSVTLTWTNTELTYNGSAQAPTATCTDFVDGDEVTITVSGAQTNAGNGYEATASINSTNYTITNSTCSFTISPKSVTITWTDQENAAPTATLSESVAFTYEYYTSTGEDLGTTAPTTAGNYTVKIVLSDTSNYTYSGNTEMSFTIEEA